MYKVYLVGYILCHFIGVHGNNLLQKEVTECVVLEGIHLCLLNYKTTQQFLVSVKHNNILFYFIIKIK